MNARWEFCYIEDNVQDAMEAECKRLEMLVFQIHKTGPEQSPYIAEEPSWTEFAANVCGEP